MRVIVCGGRDYNDWPRVSQAIYELPGDAVVVTGGATGADMLALRAAVALGLAIEVHDAQWRLYGRGAGVRRNQKMLDAGADLVIAFPGGKGTADMVRRAERAGVPVRVLR